MSLIHVNPLKSFTQIQYDYPSQKDFFLPSRATLVVCPSHLTSQWKYEAERCMPKSNVLLLCCINDHKKLSWNDVLLADIGKKTHLNFIILI